MPVRHHRAAHRPALRRVRTASAAPRESIALPAGSAGRRAPGEPRRMPEAAVSGGPYDSTLWKNDNATDGPADEGLGARGRHAP